MKLSGTKEVSVGKSYLYFGYNFKGIRLCFSVDRHSIDIDLVFFWVSWGF